MPLDPRLSGGLTLVATAGLGYALRDLLPYPAQAAGLLAAAGGLTLAGVAPGPRAGLALASLAAAGGALLSPRVAHAAVGPTGLPPGFAFLVWTGDGLTRSWAAQRAWVEQVQPQILVAHITVGGYAGAAEFARTARAAVPGVRLWLELDPVGVVGTLATVGRFVDAAGPVEAVVYNPEAAWKTSTLVERRRVSANAQAILVGTRAAHPGVAIGFTSYGAPTLHHDLCWAAWAKGRDDSGTYDLGASFFMAQVYPVGERPAPGLIAPGRMAAAEARALASFHAAQREGIVGRDVVRGVLAPSAHVAAGELVDACQASPWAGFWPWHGRYDEDGLRAARALADRWR